MEDVGVLGRFFGSHLPFRHRFLLEFTTDGTDGAEGIVESDHYTFFGVQFRGLCSRLPSASHTASQRSHFGSAADPVASLWSGGT